MDTPAGNRSNLKAGGWNLTALVSRRLVKLNRDDAGYLRANVARVMWGMVLGLGIGLVWN